MQGTGEANYPVIKHNLKLAYKRGDIGETEKTEELKRVSNARDVFSRIYQIL